MSKTLSRLAPLVALLTLLTFATPSWAGQGQAMFDHFFTGLKSLQTDFSQTLLDPDGHVLEQSEGKMSILRPGRFRLQYTVPYHSLYVADGTNIWMYDQDLEQVTVRPQADSLDNTPALLLSSDKPISDGFTVKEQAPADGLFWLQLKPKRKDASFESIRIGVAENEVKVMEMVDGFGQTTRLRFSLLQRNPSLPASLFRFTPPSGVDVIGKPK